MLSVFRFWGWVGGGSAAVLVLLFVWFDCARGCVVLILFAGLVVFA